MNGLTSRRSWLGMVVAGTAAAALLAGAGLQPASSQPSGKQPSKTEAKALPKIGDAAPDFTLKDTAGKEHVLSKYVADGKIVVLEWFNPDCPVSRQFHTSSNVMVETFDAYKDQGVVWLAINSGGEGKQGAGVERNAKALEEFKINYPILIDEPGTVGRAYGAKTTPHMYIIADGKLAYMGAIVDQGNEETNYVGDALKQIVAKETVTKAETQPFGCGVKYGPEPKKSN
jgi:peroxiredoxin